MKRWKLWVALILLAAAVPAVVIWRSYPDGDSGFDTGTNGIWVGHKWYTGHEVRTRERVRYADVDRLVATLREARIHYVYIHVGPVLPNGSIEDSVDPLLTAVFNAYPEATFLAWLGARSETVSVDDAEWRKAVAKLNMRLRDEGFAGVHFDLEPLRDGHIGYLELLSTVREELGDDWIISQATPRSSPIGVSIGPFRRSFWSNGFYQATMEFADQTVLMAYDSSMPIELAYVAFVRDQTQRLTRLACRAARHEILIGIPSYHDGPEYSKRHVENIRTASLGVRAALESFDNPPPCFRGVSVYSNWVTDEREWDEYARHWLRPGDTQRAALAW
jgi:hypothetical protein